jgi:putative SOS response-associated peptidase YedK
MCGRYTLTRQEDIAEDFHATLEGDPQLEWWKPRYNVAPTQPAPVVVQKAEQKGEQKAERKIEMMRWGLVPHWSGPGGKKAPPVINARVESLEAKAMFREAVRRRRCLVPANGFFEWVRDPNAGSKAKPQPIYMRPASGRLVGFAGLWERAGEQLSFTIITGKPNELVKRYHDRMPIIVDPDQYGAWLDPDLPAEGAYALLGIAPVGDWVADPVSTVVNSAMRDEPACIEPLEIAPAAQRSLFE